MLKRVVAGALVGTAVLASACSTVSVRTDSARDISLSICHTYAFAQEHVANADQPAAYANPLNAERLRHAVQANLAAHGIQPAVDRGGADCIVGYALGTRQVFDNYYGGIGVSGFYGRGWGRAGYGFGFYDQPWVQNEVRIAVDIFDARSHKPIWHASASQDTNELAGAQAEAKIDSATAAIFQKLPTVGGTTT